MNNANKTVKFSLRQMESCYTKKQRVLGTTPEHIESRETPTLIRVRSVIFSNLALYYHQPFAVLFLLAMRLLGDPILP